MPGSVQFFDDEGPLETAELTDGQASVMTDIPAGATRVVVVSQRPPDPPPPVAPEQVKDYDLVVTVRVYGGRFSAADAAVALRAAGTLSMGDDAEVEILTARPAAQRRG